ncbi:hypothetical protein [Arthrobacter sp. SX1312]|uniref:hypothetical protein n=1 Tax=Arthrobacter sp. SX1312 TaxID=2058896 RepID=UPI000CE3B7BD|nr:hypothetical protein [Arthrobacter sp. SX1312]
MGRTNRDPSGTCPFIIAVVAVAMFWVAGAIGGIGFLTDASSPMTMLTGLYIGLAAVAVSIIIATLALNDIARRYARTRSRRGSEAGQQGEAQCIRQLAAWVSLTVAGRPGRRPATFPLRSGRSGASCLPPHT